MDKIATIKFFDATNKLKALFPKSLIIAFLLVFLVFFLTTPFALLDFPAFANDMLEQLFVAKTGYKGFSGNGWMGLNNLLHLNHAIGTPLLLLALCGFMWGLGIFFKKPNKITAIFLFAPIIYFLSISNWRISATRYTLLLLPFMAFWAAAHINLSQNFSKSFRLLFLTAVIFVGLYSSYYTFRGVHCFAMDTRDNSANWIRDNIPLGSQVEVYSYKFYLPNFPNGLNVQRIVLNMPPSLDYNKFKAKIRKNRFVLFILKLYGKSKINDGVAQIRLNNMSLFSIDSLSKRNPDFIVLTSFFYQRFLNRNRPNEANPYAELTYYFEQILSNHAGYEIVKVFDDKTPTGEFVNPKIIILKKVGSRSIN